MLCIFENVEHNKDIMNINKLLCVFETEQLFSFESMVGISVYF